MRKEGGRERERERGETHPALLKLHEPSVCVVLTVDGIGDALLAYSDARGENAIRHGVDQVLTHAFVF